MTPVQYPVAPTPVVVAEPESPVLPVEPEQEEEESATIPLTPVVGGGLKSTLTKACAAAGAYQLWFILLALFMLLVGVVAFIEPPLANRMAALPLVAILVPLALLLGFWYLTPLCRVASWIPLILILAAGIGIFTAFRDRELPLTNVIELPAAQKKVPTVQPTPPVWPTKNPPRDSSSTEEG